MKKACSPAEKRNSSEQSRQVSVRSWYTFFWSSWLALGGGPGPARCRPVPAESGGIATAGTGADVGPGTHSGENTRGVNTRHATNALYFGFEMANLARS